MKIPEVQGFSKKIFRRKEYSAIRSRDPKIIFNELEQKDGVPIRKVGIRNTNLPSIKLSNMETIPDDDPFFPIKPRWKTPINNMNSTNHFSFHTSIEHSSRKETIDLNKTD